MQDQPNPSAAQPDAAAPAPAVEVMPSLEGLLKTAELQAAEHHDAWLRAKAETENVRRRALEDVARASKFAVEKFAGELLPVKDSLEAALANENQSAENLKAGVELTLKQLIAAFDKSGLAEINPPGEKFDPHRHQAISQIEADGEPNTIISVLQKGYALNDRVLRPALVVVSRARAGGEA
ncbi:MAG: nucleotide exchange factor GrpE [Betaproteobacteria bacterium HGW-Betaproteobacteria-11]|nr:MAG: nucleotide exchange factor GrpE [Betaproteobacteria bacterium HGW-Betaproteobacteria-11]